ncbi:MAG: pantoate--beta-alanine ligase [Planctomycetes bacterium]|jgi:pantoate--beta-alanine ligase|nr:pantoate--beta-alanine ligase [Planctomycetota bacterium]
MDMLHLDNPSAASEWCVLQREQGRSLGFVATMGALHSGHMSLVRRAAAENDLVAVSVFVNPLQFNDPGDLDSYPRQLEGDCALVAGAGGSMLFTGSLEEFFPGKLAQDGGLEASAMVDPGSGAEGLEGEFRPGHFAGVATIVKRLFEVTQPTRAYFGLKDFQQCLVVRDLALAQGKPEVVLCPTVREQDGLALSSRNLLLSDEWRAEAPRIQQALRATRALWQQGQREASILRACLVEGLADSALEVEYAAVRDSLNWTRDEPEGSLVQAVGLVAAKAGEVRLIDNLLLHMDGGVDSV